MEEEEEGAVGGESPASSGGSSPIPVFLNCPMDEDEDDDIPFSLPVKNFPTLSQLKEAEPPLSQSVFNLLKPIEQNPPEEEPPLDNDKCEGMFAKLRRFKKATTTPHSNNINNISGDLSDYWKEAKLSLDSNAADPESFLHNFYVLKEAADYIENEVDNVVNDAPIESLVDDLTRFLEALEHPELLDDPDPMDFGKKRLDFSPVDVDICDETCGLPLLPCSYDEFKELTQDAPKPEEKKKCAAKKLEEEKEVIFLEAKASDDNEEDETVLFDKLRTRLREECAKRKEGYMPLEEFLIDVNSFEQTVRNYFGASFLIHDLSMYLYQHTQEGMLVAPVPQDMKEKLREKTISQVIITITQEQWARYVQELGKNE